MNLRTEPCPFPSPILDYVRGLLFNMTRIPCSTDIDFTLGEHCSKAEQMVENLISAYPEVFQFLPWREEQQVFKKLQVVKIPKEWCNELPAVTSSHFVRALLDVESQGVPLTFTNEGPTLHVEVNRKAFPVLERMFKIWKIHFEHRDYFESKIHMEIRGNSLFDLCSILYDNISDCFTENVSKYHQLLSWARGAPQPNSSDSEKAMALTRVFCCSSFAVLPTRLKASDVGWALTVIRKSPDISPCIAVYETDLKIQPAWGFYFEVLGTPDLIRKGYEVVGGRQLVTPGGFETACTVMLKALQPDCPLPLPCSDLRLILRRTHHTQFQECKTIEEFKGHCENNLESNLEANPSLLAHTLPPTRLTRQTI